MECVCMPAEDKSLLASDGALSAPQGLPVLIVDDDAVILTMLRDLVEDVGFTVLTARDGKAALALIQRTPVGLVLTDLMMPYVTGFQLAQHLRSNPATAAIPVLLMSAALPSHIADAFTAVIPKPF